MNLKEKGFEYYKHSNFTPSCFMVEELAESTLT